MTPSALPAIIMARLRTAGHRYTPRDLERSIAAEHRVPLKTVRTAIKALVAENRVVYTHFLGHSFLEISYRKPVNVGGGIILTPPDVTCTPGPGQTVVRIAPGAAFGMGDHPTTRIALQLMAWGLDARIKTSASCADICGRNTGGRALDIGTGSGILAIAACLLTGTAEAVGIDIDACARVEAAENVRLNNLGNRVRITDADLDAMIPSFDLILANLRYPSLARINRKLHKLGAPDALLILSGFRKTELPGLLAAYPPNGFNHLRTLVQNDWCGILLRKNARRQL